MFTPILWYAIAAAAFAVATRLIKLIPAVKAFSADKSWIWTLVNVASALIAATVSTVVMRTGFLDWSAAGFAWLGVVELVYRYVLTNVDRLVAKMSAKNLSLVFKIVAAVVGVVSFWAFGKDASECALIMGALGALTLPIDISKIKEPKGIKHAR